MTQIAGLAEAISRMESADQRREEAPMTELQAQARAKSLVDCLESLTKPAPQFKVGDLIQVRSDIYVMYSKPRRGEPAVVLQTEGVVVQPCESSRLYRNTTIVIGVIDDDDGDAIRFAVDPFYFEYYAGLR